MTTFKRGGVYHYEFEYKGQRHRGSTGQRTKSQAERVEQQLKDRVRAAAHGITTVTREDTPSFSAWAGIALQRWPRASKRPKELRSRIAVCLEFWGRTPTKARPQPAVPRPGPEPPRPYHNLRLLDPITDPSWILKFEDWMTARRISGSRKNQLRSTMSMLYVVALKPAFRKTARVETNPFLGLDRDRVRRRQRVLTLDEIARWMDQAPYHLRVAIALAVYAPKLRLGEILALKFGEHIDRELTRIVVADHKADAHRPPHVVPIVAELRTLLAWVRDQNRSDFVIEWQGAGVASVQAAVRASVRAAGFVHGRRDAEGVTFHTIRHSMSTFLTQLPTLSERMRAEIMGQTIQTAQLYTHLTAAHQVMGHEQIAAAAPVARAIVGGVFGGRAGGVATGNAPKLLRRVPRRPAVGTSAGSSDRAGAKTRRKSPDPEGTAAPRRRRPKSR